MAGCRIRSARTSTPTPCAWKSPTSWRCCSIRWPRPSSSTRSAPATSPARCSCWRSAPCTCCAAGIVEFARRSMTVAASFGLASALSVVVLGDESGYTAGREPEDEDRRHRGDVGHRAGAGLLHARSACPTRRSTTRITRCKVPWVLGLIATRSLDTPVPGITELVRHARTRTSPTGMIAYARWPRCKQHRDDASRCARRSTRMSTIWAMRLLLKQLSGPTSRTPPPPQIARRRRQHRSRRAGAVLVASASWSGLRLLVHRPVRRQLLVVGQAATGSLSACICGRRCLTLPLPWIAAELGWIVAEYGRQPWVIEGVLPTCAGRLVDLPTGNVLCSACSALSLFYSALLVVDLYLMLKYIRLGPDGRASPRRRTGAPDGDRCSTMKPCG